MGDRRLDRRLGPLRFAGALLYKDGSTSRSLFFLHLHNCSFLFAEGIGVAF